MRHCIDSLSNASFWLAIAARGCHVDATPTILAKTPSREAERFCDLFYLLTVANFDPKSASLIRTTAKIDDYYTRADWKNRRMEESPEGFFRRTTWKVGVKIRRIRRFRELCVILSKSKYPMCLHCVYKVSGWFSKSCGTSWIPLTCTTYATLRITKGNNSNRIGP